MKAVSAGIRLFRPELGVGSYAVKYQDKKVKNTILEGDTASVKDVFDLPMASGRWFSDVDDPTLRRWFYGYAAYLVDFGRSASVARHGFTLPCIWLEPSVAPSHVKSTCVDGGHAAC